MSEEAALRILLVEDDAVDRIAVKRQLSRPDGSIVIEDAVDRDSCLAQVSAKPIDCILMDFQLPGPDGLEVIQALRERAIDVPVVMLTGASDDQLAQRVLAAGAVDYLVKDEITATRLQQTVRNAVAARQREQLLRRYDKSLRILAEGTAGYTGEEFFPALVHHLGLAFAAKQVWIATVPGKGSEAETIAYWSASGDHKHRWHYQLAGSACIDTLMGHGLRYRERCQYELVDSEGSLHIDDNYLGIPLRQENARAMGVLVMIGVQIDTDLHAMETVLSIFAQRTLGELLRMRQHPVADEGQLLRGQITFLERLLGHGRMEPALQALREACGADRLLFYRSERLDDGRPALRLRCHCTAEAFQGLSFVNAEPIPWQSHLPRWYEACNGREILLIETATSSGGEARLLTAEGVHSCLLIPADGGVLRMDRLEAEAEPVPDELITILRQSATWLTKVDGASQG